MTRLLRRREVSSTTFILCLAAFLMTFTNAAFFSNVADAYPPGEGNLLFLASVAGVFTAVTVLGLALVGAPYVLRPLAVVVVLVAAVTGYFMDTYNTIIDDTMMRNVVNTDPAEVLDLLGPRLFAYVLLLGIVPAVLICRTRVTFRSPGREVLARSRLIGGSLLAIAVLALPLSDHYSSFLRTHKGLRYYSNPGGIIYGSCKLARALVGSGDEPLRQVGLDARIADPDGPRRLVIFVVGESARADRFSLNGYERRTNPHLEELPVVSLTDFWSYGTSTAISVPYMFSLAERSDFDVDDARNTENVLDVIQRAGAEVRWLDNNSSSKGVAERVPYLSCKSRKTNPDCDVEPRDEGMLSHLQPWIDAHPKGHLLVILHAMGSHGPAYHARYPAEFERFTPVATTNQLQDCTDEEIGNAYDNTIVYADHFLAETVELLRRNDDAFDVAMLYVSDHGESLGENGIYLHGLPDFVAPDAQRHVPAVVWIGDGFAGIDVEALRGRKDEPFTHDFVAHSLLGLMDVETSVYDPSLDLFR